MTIIRILDEFTVGQIAAGEVVQRPVSVVKELVENSLDAGSDQIIVDVTEGGKKEISVADNGCGISQEELSLAFYRHATSKIINAKDLYSLTTLGFRGEALPSIAAVTDLVLKSRTRNSSTGHRIHIRGGEILSIEPTGCPPGTSVFLKDLFYNTPARRKHLRAKGTESSLVADMVQCMALARPNVRFLLKNNNRVVFRSTGSGKLIDAVGAVYGVNTVKDMRELDTSNEDINISGLVGKPSLNKKTRSHIYLFVNGRYVRNKSMYNAVDEAYSGLIPGGRHPVAIVFLQLDPSMLDVNIHPAKLDIRIDREQEVINLLKESIRQCLRNPFLIPDYDKIKIDKSEPGNKKTTDDLISNNKSEPRLKSEKNNFDTYKQKKFEFNYNEQPESVKEDDRKRVDRSSEIFYCDNSGNSFPFLQVIGQLLPTYIITAGPEGMYIVDQHAAHERIIYENLLKSKDAHNKQVQMLLNSVPLELNYSKIEILRENKSYFEELGFEIEEFGDDTYIVRGIPSYLSTGEGIEQLLDLLEELSSVDIKKSKDLMDTIIITLSCKAAIKSGEVMSFEGMNSIVQQLSSVWEPYTCPHGRPTLVKITEKQLLQMFKRTN